IHGRGAHAARPQEGVDPIVIASHVVLALQTLVARTIDPMDEAVVTVGAINGGTKRNVIPDDVTLQLSVRSFTPAVRERLLAGIRGICDEICRAFECPAPPTVTVGEDATPAAWNDPALAGETLAWLRATFGDGNADERRREMIAEDFGRIPATGGVPGVMIRV